MTAAEVVSRSAPDPLARIVNATQELAATCDLEVIRSIRDFAVVAREYARAKKLGKEAVAHATQIINEATRREGEVLIETPKEKPGPKPKELGSSGVPNSSPRKKAGKKLSAVAQRLATLPEEIFKANAKKPTKQLDRLARDLATEKARDDAAATVTDLHGEISIRCCSAAELAAELNADSVDLIFTDPPYPEEFLPVWSDLGALAARALKPGALLVAYTGQLFLPQVMHRLDEHLNYWWTFAVQHDGAFFELQIRHMHVGWKPLLVYRKPGGAKLPPWVNDFTAVGGREKDGHDWQQAEAEAAYWVGGLTTHESLIVDPFLGSGTTATACKTLGRRFIGADKDPLAVQKAQERVS